MTRLARLVGLVSREAVASVTVVVVVSAAVSVVAVVVEEDSAAGGAGSVTASRALCTRSS